MARKIRSVTTDIRYRDFVRRYRYNWHLAAAELFGKYPTFQQDEIIDSVQQIGSRTTVASGHGTGKSDMTSIMLLCFMLSFPGARVVLVANKLDQVKTGVFKYLKENWNTCIKRAPWLQNYFVVTDTMFYERTRKGVWSVQGKGYRLGNEEALAGEHADHLLIIVDEASGLSDKALSVLRGALTQTDNRLLLLSQPTRPTGHFYESHHSLAKSEENPDGEYTAIVLNSEESPLVTVKFIKDKMVEYGGRDAPEYQIKVLGQFPQNVSGYLLGRHECDLAARRQVRLKRGWGWIACCDVGNGRDKSVISIFKVSGYRMKRRVVPHAEIEMPGTCDPISFGQYIVGQCRPELYPNMTVVIDGDGVGADTATIAERSGLRVQRIRWGRPMHSTDDKKRFKNERAYANIMARDAVKQGRHRLTANTKTISEASKIPCGINELGQWAIMPKKEMRAKHNIPSPDHWDTHCFAHLAHYIPANEVLNDEVAAERNNIEEWLKAELNGAA
ncbi:MAG TPA: terminase [Buttiauxella sp.]|jgi:hypothetical protein